MILLQYTFCVLIFSLLLCKCWWTVVSFTLINFSMMYLWEHIKLLLIFTSWHFSWYILLLIYKNSKQPVYFYLRKEWYTMLWFLKSCSCLNWFSDFCMFKWRSQKFYRVWAKKLSQNVTSFLRIVSHFLQIISYFLRIISRFLRIYLSCGS